MKPVLQKLQKILAREVSAIEIAKRAGCSLPTTYRHIEALKELGAVIAESKEPRKKTGPTPTKFRLVRAVPLTRV